MYSLYCSWSLFGENSFDSVSKTPLGLFTLRLLTPRCLWRFWLFSIRSQEPRLLSFSLWGIPAPIASNAPCWPRKGWGRDRKEGQRRNALESLPERRFASVAERTRADSLCTHSRCYFRPTRRRYRRSSFAPLFHTRFILRFPRRISPKIVVLSAILLIPSLSTKEFIHSLTPCLSPSEDSLVSRHYECHRLYSTRQNCLIDRSISFLAGTMFLTFALMVSFFFSLSRSPSLSRSCDVATLTIRATSSTTPSGGCARGKLGAKCQKSRRLK